MKRKFLRLALANILLCSTFAGNLAATELRELKDTLNEKDYKKLLKASPEIKEYYVHKSNPRAYKKSGISGFFSGDNWVLSVDAKKSKDEGLKKTAKLNKEKEKLEKTRTEVANIAESTSYKNLIRGIKGTWDTIKTAEKYPDVSKSDRNGLKHQLKVLEEALRLSPEHLEKLKFVLLGEPNGGTAAKKPATLEELNEGMYEAHTKKKIGNEQVCKHAIEITKSGKNIPEEIKKIEEKAKKVQLKKDREKTLKKLLSPIRPMKIHAIEPQKPFVSENNPTEKKTVPASKTPIVHNETPVFSSTFTSFVPTTSVATTYTPYRTPKEQTEYDDELAKFDGKKENDKETLLRLWDELWRLETAHFNAATDPNSFKPGEKIDDKELNKDEFIKQATEHHNEVKDTYQEKRKIIENWEKDDDGGEQIKEFEKLVNEKKDELKDFGIHVN